MADFSPLWGEIFTSTSNGGRSVLQNPAYSRNLSTRSNDASNSFYERSASKGGWLGHQRP